MKKILTLVALSLCISLSGYAAGGLNYARKYAPTDPNILYTGRVEVKDGTVSYDWVGTYLQMGFTGTGIAVEIAEKGESYHNVFVDGKWVVKLHFTGDTPHRVTLVEGLKKGKHLLRLQKCTEGEYGCTTLSAVYLSAGGTLFPVQRKERMIEFIGDSYTCGFGTESNQPTEPFRLDTENCNKAYGCIIARYFNADYVLVAHSGRGMVRNYGDNVQRSEGTMRSRYLQVYDQHATTPYDFKAYTPDLVVINLGTNDFSTIVTPTPQQYVDAYIQMIDTIRGRYGQNIPVLCVKAHSANRYLTTCLELLKQRMYADKKVFFAGFPAGLITPDKDLGASYHPNYHGNKKLSMSIIPQIASIMGWDMIDKAVE